MVGKELSLVMEDDNGHAVIIVKDGCIVGHKLLYCEVYSSQFERNIVTHLHLKSFVHAVSQFLLWAMLVIRIPAFIRDPVSIPLLVFCSNQPWPLNKARCYLEEASTVFREIFVHK